MELLIPPDPPGSPDPLTEPDPLLLDPCGDSGEDEEQPSAPPALPPVTVTSLSGTMRLYSCSAGGSPLRAPPGKPLVLLLPWLGARGWALARFLSLYLRQGLDVLLVGTAVAHVLWPRHGQRLAGRLLRLLHHGDTAGGGTGGDGDTGGSAGGGSAGIGGDGGGTGVTGGDGAGGSGGHSDIGGNGAVEGKGGINGIGGTGAVSSGGTGVTDGGHSDIGGNGAIEGKGVTGGIGVTGAVSSGGTGVTGGGHSDIGCNDGFEGDGGAGSSGGNAGMDAGAGKGGTGGIGRNSSTVGSGGTGVTGGGCGDVGWNSDFEGDGGGNRGGNGSGGTSGAGGDGSGGDNSDTDDTGGPGGDGGGNSDTSDTGGPGGVGLATRPLLVHAISAGAYTFAQLLLLLQRRPRQCQRLRPRVRGIVYDSLVTGGIGDMARGIAGSVRTPSLRPLARAAARLSLGVLGCWGARAFAQARAAFARPPLRCPLLLFYSLDDALGRAPALRALLRGWRAQGIRAHARGWPRSPHAAHLRRHPAAYQRALLAFLRSLDGITPPARPRARL